MNSSFRVLAVLLLLGQLSLASYGQSPAAGLRVLSLKEVVQMAKEQSPAYRQAITKLSNRSWQYQTFRSNYLPQLNLNGVLPDLNRGIDQVRQPDGTFRFVRVSQVNYPGVTQANVFPQIWPYFCQIKALMECFNTI
jgi:hypothetical protein